MTSSISYLHITMLDPISEALEEIWEFSLEIYTSPFYKSGTSIIKGLAAFNSLIEPTFSDLSKMSECVESIGKFSFSVIATASKGSKNISTVFKFILLKDLPKKAKKAFEQLQNSFESGDFEQILNAELKFISVIGKCIEIPRVIQKFLDLIPGNLTPIIFKTFTAPLGQIGVVFSFFSLVEKKRSLDATNKLIDELNSIEQQKISECFDKYLRAPSVSSGEGIEVKEKKTKKSFKCDLRIAEITAVANRAFLQELADRISQDPELIKTHFKISEGIDFFAKLQEENVQGDPKKLNRAVKLIKMRLDEKITADKYSLFFGACSVSSSVIAIFQVFGLAFPPITFIATVASGVGPLVSTIVTLYEYHRKNEFSEALMEITCSAA